MLYLKQAESVEEIEHILKDPEIFGRISEDGIVAASYEVPFDGHQIYMKIMVDDQLIGVWIVYPDNRTTLNIHCNILKDHREHGKSAGNLILEWFALESEDSYQKLNAEIPVIYNDVYHFTKSFGFADEGINRQSIMKGGTIVDQYRLGITRAEVIEYLEG